MKVVCDIKRIVMWETSTTFHLVEYDAVTRRARFIDWTGAHTQTKVVYKVSDLQPNGEEKAHAKS